MAPRPDPSVTISAQWTSGQFANPGNYDDPALDQQLTAVRSTTDLTAQKTAYQAMAKFVAQNALDVPVAFPSLSAPHTDKVLGEVEQNENCQFVNFRTLAKTKSGTGTGAAVRAAAPLSRPAVASAVQSCVRRPTEEASASEDQRAERVLAGRPSRVPSAARPSEGGSQGHERSPAGGRTSPQCVWTTIPRMFLPACMSA